MAPADGASGRDGRGVSVPDYGNLDAFGVDESSLIDRIEVNRRIRELSSRVDVLRMERDDARRIAEEFRDNFAEANPDQPRIPIPWEASR